MTPNSRSSVVPCLVLLTSIIFTYHNVFAVPYAFTDDYTFLDSITSGRKDLLLLLVTVGRATQAGIILFFFSIFSTVESLRHLRLLGIVGTGLFSWCLYRHIFRLTQKKVFATCAAFAICMLPSFQVYASWTQYFSMPYACAAAFLSYQAANRALRANGALKKALFSIATLILLLLSLTTHPIAGFFFAFFLATELLHGHEDLKPTVKRILVIMSLFSVGLALSYALLILGKHWFPDSDSNRDALTHDVIGKIKWFVRRPLYESLSGPFVPASKLAACLNLAVTAFGMIVASGWTGITRIRKVGIAIAFVPFVYLPNLMVGESWSSYRTQAVLAALLLYYLFHSIDAIGSSSRWKTRSSEAIAVSACIALSLFFGLNAASNTIRFFSLPQAIEYQYVKGRLAAFDPSRHAGIYYIRSSRQDSLAPFASYDEFGLPSGSQPWVPKPFVLSILHDRKLPDADRIVVQEIEPDTPLPEHGFLLDLRGIHALN